MSGLITIVGLGPAGPEQITAQTRDAIRRSERRFLRTSRHPAAVTVEDATTFDAVYDRADTFADVYAEITERLIAEAALGDLLYAVPGSPLVLEQTVERLRAAAAAGRVEIELMPALSFLDAVWARLRIDPIEAGIRLVDGHVFATAAAGHPGPLLVAHCHARHVLSDIKLAVDEPPVRVVVLQRLGLPEEAVFDIEWAELDRGVEPDHLTSVYIPELAQPVAAEFVRFDELVRVLRDECPWDREQTHSSLRRHLLEETHETIEALDARASISDDEVDADLDEHLAEELGDLLYQIFFHARVAAERGSFAVSDVVRGIHDKLVSRHPHVFGDVDAVDSSTVVRNWDQIKAAEKGRGSSMDGIPPSLPALMLAAKYQKRASAAGVDIEPSGAGASLVAGSPQTETELGDLLFALVDAARRLDLDPEAALRAAAQRFADQVRQAETT